MKRRAKFLPAAVLTSTAMVLTFISGGSIATAAPIRTYFVSASAGSDTNAGTSAAHPWRTFAPVNARTLHPGDRVLLRGGDTWTGQELDPTGSGTPQRPIVISSYGPGARPHIAPGIGIKTYAIHLVDNGGYDISNLEISDTYGGVAAYDDRTYGHRYLHITNSVFHDITGKDTGFVIQPPGAPGDSPTPDLYFGTAVAVSGYTDGPTLFSGILLDRDTFYRDDAAFDQVERGPAYTHNVWSDVTIQNSEIYDMYRTGGIVIYCTANVLVNHVRAVAAGGYDNVGMYWGDAAMQFVYDQNVTVENSEMLGTLRPTDPDGEGFDFEGMNIGIQLVDSYLADNEGSSMLFFQGWGGPSNGIRVQGNRLDNNGGDRTAHAVFFTFPGNQGAIQNNTIRLQAPEQPYDPNYWPDQTGGTSGLTFDPRDIVYAPDGTQVFGDTHPSADLSVQTHHVGATYVVTVHNNGTNPAPSTTLNLDPAAANGAATKVETSTGYCWLPLLEDNGATNCLLGSLQPGQTATVVALAAPGSNTYPAATADVSSGITDPNPTNNQSQQ